MPACPSCWCGRLPMPEVIPLQPLSPSGAVLRTDDHARDSAGFTYIYPVVSRRAGGVSIGVNLNPNNACNWACVYCQVPDLQRGGPPPINLAQLEDELRAMLTQIVHGDFMQTRVPENARRINDVAFSGNGEPTMSRNLARHCGWWSGNWRRLVCWGRSSWWSSAMAARCTSRSAAGA